VLFEMLTGEVPFKGESQVAVAMKHVREELPDVQRLRPEVSAALAAVVDRATAKRLEDRYANDAELIADLEDVLAIETARAGSATGEVTAVLRTLPAGTQRRVPFRVRHRVSAVLVLLLALVLIGGGVAWVVTRTHHGTGAPPAKAPQRGLQAVRLCQSCAQGFNPLGNPVDEAPDAALAIDNQPNTFWVTQHYFDNKLDKAGTGIYVNASPGVVGRELRITDVSPGFTAAVYARNDAPQLKAPPGNGWTQLSQPTVVRRSTTIPLNTGGSTYRYYLLWITSLGGRQQLSIDELALYR
jgi:serine/threonine-protein kinase